MSSQSILIAAARLVGGAAGLVLAVAWVAAQPGSVADAGLGLGTVSVQESHPKGSVFFGQLQNAAASARTSASSPKIYWLGASQLYAINQYTSGEHTAPYILFEALHSLGAQLVTLGFPNAYPEEHYLIVQYLLEHAPIDGLIIGAVYDDMRHGIVPEEPRIEIARAAEEAAMRDRLGKTSFGREVLANADAALKAHKLGDQGSAARVADGLTLMERSEQAVTAFIEDKFGAETLRGEGRGRALLAVSDIRRYFESLRARYTRDLSTYRVPIPADRYAANWRAWEGMLQAARQAGVRVIVYVAPRPTDFFPYDPESYARFKAELEALAKRYGAAFLDLEDLVASELFGEVDIAFGFQARDPFHFRAAGHAALASTLLPAVARIILPPQAAR